jgi:hypothetical protein
MLRIRSVRAWRVRGRTFTAWRRPHSPGAPRRCARQSDTRFHEHQHSDEQLEQPSQTRSDHVDPARKPLANCREDQIDTNRNDMHAKTLLTRDNWVARSGADRNRVGSRERPALAWPPHAMGRYSRVGRSPNFVMRIIRTIVISLPGFRGREAQVLVVRVNADAHDIPVHVSLVTMRASASPTGHNAETQSADRTSPTRWPVDE